MKRAGNGFLAFLLCLCLIFGMLPMGVLAEYGAETVKIGSRQIITEDGELWLWGNDGYHIYKPPSEDSYLTNQKIETPGFVIDAKRGTYGVGVLLDSGDLYYSWTYYNPERQSIYDAEQDKVVTFDVQEDEIVSSNVSDSTENGAEFPLENFEGEEYQYAGIWENDRFDPFKTPDKSHFTEQRAELSDLAANNQSGIKHVFEESSDFKGNWPEGWINEGTNQEDTYTQDHDMMALFEEQDYVKIFSDVSDFAVKESMFALKNNGEVWATGFKATKPVALTQNAIGLCIYDSYNEQRVYVLEQNSSGYVVSLYEYYPNAGRYKVIKSVEVGSAGRIIYGNADGFYYLNQSNQLYQYHDSGSVVLLKTSVIDAAVGKEYLYTVDTRNRLHQWDNYTYQTKLAANNASRTLMSSSAAAVAADRVNSGFLMIDTNGNVSGFGAQVPSEYQWHFPDDVLMRIFQKGEPNSQRRGIDNIRIYSPSGTGALDDMLEFSWEQINGAAKYIILTQNGWYQGTSTSGWIDWSLYDKTSQTFYVLALDKDEYVIAIGETTAGSPPPKYWSVTEKTDTYYKVIGDELSILPSLWGNHNSYTCLTTIRLENKTVYDSGQQRMICSSNYSDYWFGPEVNYTPKQEGTYIATISYRNSNGAQREQIIEYEISDEPIPQLQQPTSANIYNISGDGYTTFLIDFYAGYLEEGANGYLWQSTMFPNPQDIYMQSDHPNDMLFGWDGDDMIALGNGIATVPAMAGTKDTYVTVVCPEPGVRFINFGMSPEFLEYMQGDTTIENDEANIFNWGLLTVPESMASDFIYQEDENGGIVITGYQGESNFIRIPKTIEGQTVTSIQSGAFENIDSILTMYLPSGIKEIEPGAFAGCSSLAGFYLNAENNELCVQDGVLYNKDMTELIAYPGGNGAQAFELPSSVEVIYGQAFSGCEYLQSVMIPSGVREIGMKAFSQCPNLTVSISAQNPYYSVLDNVIFNKDKTILLQYPDWQDGLYEIPFGVKEVEDFAFWGAGLSVVKIPEGVVKLGDNAFSGCGLLQSVSLPASIEILGENAFFGCVSLNNVYFRGNAPDTANVGIGVFDDCGNDFAIYKRQISTGFEEVFGGYRIVTIDEPREAFVSIVDSNISFTQQIATIEVTLKVLPQAQLPGSATLAVACYQEQKMVGIATQAIALKDGTVTLNVPCGQDISRYKVMLLDDMNTAYPLMTSFERGIG